MPDPKEIVIAPAKLLKELPASLIVAGERRFIYCQVPTPHPTKKRRDGKPALVPLRRKRVDGKKVNAWENGRGLMRAVPCRVPRSKVIACGLGTITLPRYVAASAGLI